MKRRSPEEIITDMIDNHAAMGKDMNSFQGSPRSVPLALNYHAKIVYHTAELAEVSSHKLERLTEWLVGCTLALVTLAIALAALTWMLAKYGH